MALGGKRVKVWLVPFTGIPGDVERCGACTRKRSTWGIAARSACMESTVAAAQQDRGGGGLPLCAAHN